MKLSQLEMLVKAMREQAARSNVEDPNVEFYCFRQTAVRFLDTPNVFMRLEPEADTASTIKQHMTHTTTELAQRGDFAIPLELR